MTRVVMFSGGLGSYAAARRVVDAHGPAGVVLLFADTLIEDADLYRFLEDAAANLGVTVTRIADGRSPWDVFKDERFLGNSRIDPCSRILKRELTTTWLQAHCDPAATTVYVGIDWTEAHRFTRLQARYAAAGWRYEAPLCDRPYLTPPQIRDLVSAAGLRRPRLYDLGFAHNNCGGFCVKAGHAHFAMLLRTLPARYAEHEANETAIRDKLGDVSILTDRAGGNGKRPLTLRAFRERVEAGRGFDRFDFGGCGCFSEAS